jgi:hypothetical protein
MLRIKYLARVGGLILGLVLGNFVATSNPSAQAPLVAPKLAEGELQGIYLDPAGMVALANHAEPAPKVYGSYAQFGLFISPAQQLSSPARALRVDYDALVPSGTALRLDVRMSEDGSQWSSWEPDIADGSIVQFSQAGQFAQYRLTLLGSAQTSPKVRQIDLSAVRDGGIPLAFAQDAEQIAPTYKIHATRMGMIGGRTANGHRIVPRDHFVSLPSWRSLSSKGGHEYQVRITYNGRSSVAPVWDVGPWNVSDNYWDVERQKYKDLARGYPEDHAAYFDGYNGGWAEKGKVSFPTAIDVGDGVWWDDLGIKGDRAIVEVTFLWLGEDPLAEKEEVQPVEETPAEPAPEVTPETPVAPAEPAPAEPASNPEPTEPAPPAPAEPAPPAPAPAPSEPTAAPATPPPLEIIIDDRDEGFSEQAKVTWYDINNCGHANDALWTYSTTDPDSHENQAVWQPHLPAEAMYEVFVHIPSCGTKAKAGPSTAASYTVQHRDAVKTISINQANAAGKWVSLGTYPFAAGQHGSVTLTDVAGDSMNVLWFDAVKWVAVP